MTTLTGGIPQSVLYEQHTKVIHTFWEWRHKVLMLFISGTGGLTALDGWLYQHGLRDGILITGALGVILAFACYQMDRRNEQIIIECCRVIRLLESDADAAPQSVFAYLHSYHDKPLAERRGSYTWVFLRSYALVGAMFAASAFAGAAFAAYDVAHALR